MQYKFSKFMTPDQLESVRFNVSTAINKLAEKYGGIPTDDRLFDLAGDVEVFFREYKEGPEKDFGLAAAGNFAAKVLGEPVSDEYELLRQTVRLTEIYSRRT